MLGELKCMTPQTVYPHIEKPTDGTARLTAHPRIRVAQIARNYLLHGWSPEEIRRHHPCLSLAEAHAAMLYYLDHEEEIHAEIREELNHLLENNTESRLPFFMGI